MGRARVDFSMIGGNRMPSFGHVQIHTTRLLLRPLREADAAALFVIFSDPRVMRYWSAPAWPAIEKAHALIVQDRQDAASGKQMRLGIERTADRQLIGTCALFNFAEPCRRAEVGYGLAHPAWGQGYMHEALVALLQFAFAELALNRVEADVDPRNSASTRCLERLGFRKEGHLRQRWIVEGEISDSDVYGLLASDMTSGLKGMHRQQD
jgi:RimJ/RimL family protein N-acetyltransferase